MRIEGVDPLSTDGETEEQIHARVSRALEAYEQHVRRPTADEASTVMFDATGFYAFMAPGLQFEGQPFNEGPQLYLAKPSCPEDTDNFLNWDVFVQAFDEISLEGGELNFSNPHAGPVHFADGSHMRLGDLLLQFASKVGGKKPRQVRLKPGDGFLANDKVTKTVSTITKSVLSIAECQGEPFRVDDKVKGPIVRYIADGEPRLLNAFELSVLDAIGSLVVTNGQAVIRGADILRQVGITNPDQRGQRSTVGEYAKTVSKLMTSLISIDTTDRARRVDPSVLEEITLRPFVCGEMRLQKKANPDGGEETCDFELVLTPPNPDSLCSALPLLEHAKGLKQVVRVPRSVYDLPSGRGRNQRLIRDYLARRIGEKGTSDVIKLDAICTAVGVDPSDANGRSRVCKTAEALLKEIQMLEDGPGGRRVTGYKKQKNGRRVESFVVDTEEAPKARKRTRKKD